MWNRREPTGAIFLNRAGQLLGSLMSQKTPISGSSIACFTTHE